MNTSQLAGTTGLTAIDALLNNGKLTIYSGAMPATPETALSGNTVLATWTFSATAFGAPVFGSGAMTATASFTAASESPLAAGQAIFARAFESNGTTAVADFTVGASWFASSAVVVGQFVANGGNLYKCTTAGTTAASGGPTGTGTGITDGSAVWAFVAAGAADITLGSTTVSLGVPISLSSFTLSIPVS